MSRCALDTHLCLWNDATVFCSQQPTVKRCVLYDSTIYCSMSVCVTEKLNSINFHSSGTRCSNFRSPLTADDARHQFFHDLCYFAQIKWRRQHERWVCVCLQFYNEKDQNVQMVMNDESTNCHSMNGLALIHHNWMNCNRQSMQLRHKYAKLSHCTRILNRVNCGDFKRNCAARTNWRGNVENE